MSLLFSQYVKAVKSGTFQKTVAAAGTAERLTTEPYQARSITIKALDGNTGQVYLGDKDVSSSVGDELSPGGIRNYIAGTDEVIVMSDIWIDSAVNGEGVSVSYVPG